MSGSIKKYNKIMRMLVDENERASWKLAAAARGRTLADWVRDVLNKAAMESQMGRVGDVAQGLAEDRKSKFYE